jgi:hypothetical protein
MNTNKIIDITIDKTKKINDQLQKKLYNIPRENGLNRGKYKIWKFCETKDKIMIKIYYDYNYLGKEFDLVNNIVDCINNNFNDKICKNIL